MIIRSFRLSLILALITLPACEKKQVTHKIVDGVPIHAEQTIVPGQAVQQYFLLTQDAMKYIVPLINRMALTGANFPELSGSGPIYNFTVRESHYGTANFTVEFRDNNNATIDPIASFASTSTLQTAILNGTGNSAFLSYTANLTIDLQTTGDVLGNKRVNGTVVFTGSSYSITFTFTPPGSSVTFEGMIDGGSTSSGTGGPGSQTTTSSLLFSTSHDVNGTITWEGNEGSIHFDTKGPGFIVTNQNRFMLD